MKNEPIILVQNPHQLSPRVYGFRSEKEFGEWLEDFAPAGFSYTPMDKNDLLEKFKDSGEDAEWFEKWIEPPLAILNAGAKKVVEVWYNEGSWEWFDEKEAPGKIDCILHSMDDFHQQVVLDKKGIERILAGDNGRLSYHQVFKVVREIKDTAASLGFDVTE